MSSVRGMTDILNPKKGFKVGESPQVGKDPLLNGDCEEPYDAEMQVFLSSQLDKKS